MRKRMIIGLAVFGLLFAAGCTGKTNTTVPQENSNTGTEGLSAETEAVTPTVTPETDSTTNGEIPTQTPDVSGDYIGEDIARATAVEHAGLTEGDVTFIKVQLDRDDGRTVYDVEFFYGNTEYDYEIDAVSGEIAGYDQDIENYNIQAQAQQQGNVISIDQAKQAALAAAGLNDSGVKWVKEKLDYDDGRNIYELECISGETEYDFEINAADGTILEQSRESIYD